MLATGRETEALEDIEWGQGKNKTKLKLFAAIAEQGREERPIGWIFPAKLDLTVSQYLGFYALLILVGVAGYLAGNRRNPQPVVL